MKDSARLSKRVFDHVEASLPDGSPGIDYEFMPSDPESLPRLSMQTLAGTPHDTDYIDGSYIARYRFAVYLRQRSDDTGGRLDAIGLLEEVVDAIDGSRASLPEGFDCWGIECDNLPRKIEFDDAYDDWQATFEMKYHANRKE